MFSGVCFYLFGGGLPVQGPGPSDMFQLETDCAGPSYPRLVQLEVHCIGTPTRFSNLFPLKRGLLVSEHLNSTEMVVRFTMYISRKNAANPLSIFTSNLEFIILEQTW